MKISTALVARAISSLLAVCQKIRNLLLPRRGLQLKLKVALNALFPFKTKKKKLKQKSNFGQTVGLIQVVKISGRLTS